MLSLAFGAVARGCKEVEGPKDHDEDLRSHRKTAVQPVVLPVVEGDLVALTSLRSRLSSRVRAI